MIHSSDRAARGGLRAALSLAGGIAVAVLLACGEPEPPPESAGRPASAPPAAERAPSALAPEEPAERLGDAKIGEAGTMPEGFPEDMPLYPEARPTRWVSAPGPGSLVAFESDAAPDDVFEYYAEQLPASGWELESKMGTGGHWMVSAVKGSRKARISIAGTAQGSQFGIAVADAD